MFVQGQVLNQDGCSSPPDYIGLGASPPHPYLVGVTETRSEAPN